MSSENPTPIDPWKNIKLLKPGQSRLTQIPPDTEPSSPVYGAIEPLDTQTQQAETTKAEYPKGSGAQTEEEFFEQFARESAQRRQQTQQQRLSPPKVETRQTQIPAAEKPAKGARLGGPTARSKDFVAVQKQSKEPFLEKAKRWGSIASKFAFGEDPNKVQQTRTATPAAATTQLAETGKPKRSATPWFIGPPKPISPSPPVTPPASETPTVSSDTELSDKWKDFNLSIRPEAQVGDEIRHGPYQIYAASDKGEKQPHNQENSGIIRLQLSKETVLILADGWGDYPKGRDSSDYAINSFLSGYISLKEAQKQTDSALEEAINFAQLNIVSNNLYQKINSGTSLIVAILQDDGNYVIANVGNSRAYWVTNEKAMRLTNDHSQAFEEFLKGNIKEEQIYTSDPSIRDNITRSLGGLKEEPIEIDLYKGDLQEGEQILLCSDGLWEMTRDADGHVIHHFARDSNSQEEVVRSLIAKANENGGEDNITVVVAKRTSENPADKPGINTQVTAPPPDQEGPMTQAEINNQSGESATNTGNQSNSIDKQIEEALTYPINPPEVPESAKFYSISHLADNENPDSANKFNNYCLFWWDGEKLYTHVIDPETGNPVGKGFVNIDIAKETDEESAKRKIEAYIRTVYRGAKFREDFVWTEQGLKPKSSSKPQEPPIPPGTH